MNTTMIYLGLIFGSIGLGYFVYGKKQKKMVSLASGIGLMVIPYGISNVMVLLLVSLALMALPYFVRY